MGTRGLMGFRIDGIDKLQYNQFDTYPEGLGVIMLAFCRGAEMSELREKARALRLVENGSKAPEEEVARLRRFANLDVASKEAHDWYCLLRGTQGEPGAALEAGVMIDSSAFARDSLFCEWGYVVNLDDDVLEVYRGFQQGPHANGRYAALPPDGGNGYSPIALVGTFPLGALPSDDDFLKALHRGDEDEEAA